MCIRDSLSFVAGMQFVSVKQKQKEERYLYNKFYVSAMYDLAWNRLAPDVVKAKLIGLGQPAVEAGVQQAVRDYHRIIVNERKREP